MRGFGEENGSPFSRREVWLLAATCLGILLSRLPWIWAGYGADPDAYRIVDAARSIARTGEYAASRLPGFPAYEYLVAWTPAKTDPAFSNFLTALASGGASLFFALILRFLRVRRYLLLTLAFALTPVIYINSVSTMDYVFSLALILGSIYSALVGRPAMAGLSLGIAVGFRMTAGAMVLPISLWMVLQANGSKPGRRVLIFTFTALVTGGLFFLPVVLRYGMAFLTFYDHTGYPPMSILLKRGVFGVWGKLGALGLLALVLMAPLIRQNGRAGSARSDDKKALAVSSLAVVLYLVAFLRLPAEAGYLIPAVPFLLLLVGLVAPPCLTGFLAVTLVLSSFVTIESGGVSLSGPIIRDHRIRESQIRETRWILSTVERLPGKAVIVVGFRLPWIRAALNGRLQGCHEYVYLVKDPREYRNLVKQGRHVYFLRGMADYNLRVKGFDLRKLGARQLE